MYVCIIFIKRERHRWKSDLLICLDIRSISDIYIGKSWQNCKHLRVGFHWHKTKIWHFVNVESHNVDSQNFVIFVKNQHFMKIRHFVNSTFCAFDIMWIRHFVSSTLCEFDILWFDILWIRHFVLRHIVIRHYVIRHFVATPEMESQICIF